jgi:OOP family OmpA-OmpF porin
MLTKKNMVLTALAGAASLLVVANASAAVSGPYFGLQLGSGTIHPGAGLQTGAANAFSSLTVNQSTEFAGRVFGGYQINPMWSTELGYTRFGNTVANNPASTFTNSVNHINIRTYAIDLVAKASLPVTDAVSVYGKAGAAYLNQSGRGYSSATVFGVTSTSANTIKSDAVYPTIGAGVSYHINSNVTSDISWSHIQKVGNSRRLGNTDFFGVGLSYAIN